MADSGGYRYRVVERLHEVRGRMVTDFSSLQAVRDFIDSCRQGHDAVYHREMWCTGLPPAPADDDNEGDR